MPDNLEIIIAQSESYDHSTGDSEGELSLILSKNGNFVPPGLEMLKVFKQYATAISAMSPQNKCWESGYYINNDGKAFYERNELADSGTCCNHLGEIEEVKSVTEKLLYMFQSKKTVGHNATVISNLDYSTDTPSNNRQISYKAFRARINKVKLFGKVGGGGKIQRYIARSGQYSTYKKAFKKAAEKPLEPIRSHIKFFERKWSVDGMLYDGYNIPLEDGGISFCSVPVGASACCQFKFRPQKRQLVLEGYAEAGAKVNIAHFEKDFSWGSITTIIDGASAHALAKATCKINGAEPATVELRGESGAMLWSIISALKIDKIELGPLKYGGSCEGGYGQGIKIAGGVGGEISSTTGFRLYQTCGFYPGFGGQLRISESGDINRERFEEADERLQQSYENDTLYRDILKKLDEGKLLLPYECDYLDQVGDSSVYKIELASYAALVSGCYAVAMLGPLAIVPVAMIGSHYMYKFLDWADPLPEKCSAHDAMYYKGFFDSLAPDSTSNVNPIYNFFKERFSDNPFTNTQESIRMRGLLNSFLVADKKASMFSGNEGYAKQSSSGCYTATDQNSTHTNSPYFSHVLFGGGPAEAKTRGNTRSGLFRLDETSIIPLDYKKWIETPPVLESNRGASVDFDSDLLFDARTKEAKGVQFRGKYDTGNGNSFDIGIDFGKSGINGIPLGVNISGDKINKNISTDAQTIIELGKMLTREINYHFLSNKEKTNYKLRSRIGRLKYRITDHRINYAIKAIDEKISQETGKEGVLFWLALRYVVASENADVINDLGTPGFNDKVLECFSAPIDNIVTRIRAAAVKDETSLETMEIANLEKLFRDAYSLPKETLDRLIGRREIKLNQAANEYSQAVNSIKNHQEDSQGHIDVCIKQCENLVAEEKDANVFLLSAKAHLLANKFDEAQNALSQIFSLYAETRGREKVDLKIATQQLYDAFTIVSHCAVREGKVGKAVSFLQKAMTLNPSDLEICRNLAHLHYKLAIDLSEKSSDDSKKHVESCIEQCKNLLAKGENNPEINLLSAHANLFVGNLDKARGAIEPILSRSAEIMANDRDGASSEKEQLSNAYTIASHCALGKKHFDEATSFLQKSVDIEPFNVEKRHSLAELYHELAFASPESTTYANKKHAESSAESHYRKCLNLSPDCAEARIGFAKFLCRQERFSCAEEELLKAGELGVMTHELQKAANLIGQHRSKSLSYDLVHLSAFLGQTALHQLMGTGYLSPRAEYCGNVVSSSLDLVGYDLIRYIKFQQQDMFARNFSIERPHNRFGDVDFWIDKSLMLCSTLDRLGFINNEGHGKTFNDLVRFSSNVKSGYDTGSLIYHLYSNNHNTDKDHSDFEMQIEQLSLNLFRVGRSFMHSHIESQRISGQPQSENPLFYAAVDGVDALGRAVDFCCQVKKILSKDSINIVSEWVNNSSPVVVGAIKFAPKPIAIVVTLAVVGTYLIYKAPTVIRHCTYMAAIAKMENSELYLSYARNIRQKVYELNKGKEACFWSERLYEAVRNWAITGYQEELKKRPNERMAIIGLRRLQQEKLFERRQYRQIIADCTSEIKKGDSDVGLYLSRVKANIALRNFWSAKCDLKLLPDNSETSRQLATLHHMQGNFYSAKAACRREITLTYDALQSSNQRVSSARSNKWSMFGVVECIDNSLPTFIRNTLFGGQRKYEAAYMEQCEHEGRFQAAKEHMTDIERDLSNIWFRELVKITIKVVFPVFVRWLLPKIRSMTTYDQDDTTTLFAHSYENCGMSLDSDFMIENSLEDNSNLESGSDIISTTSDEVEETICEGLSNREAYLQRKFEGTASYHAQRRTFWQDRHRQLRHNSNAEEYVQRRSQAVEINRRYLANSNAEEYILQRRQNSRLFEPYDAEDTRVQQVSTTTLSHTNRRREDLSFRSTSYSI